MRLKKVEQYIAKVMIFAIDRGYFNYGDSVEYLPRSDKFKVNSSDLDKPLYCRFGAFYHDYLKLDKETQEQILTDYENNNDWYRIWDFEELDYEGQEYKSFALAYRHAIGLLKQGKRVEIEFWDSAKSDTEHSYIHTELLRKRGLI